MAAADSFSARSTLSVGGTEHEIYRLDALQARFDVARLPYSLKILLENLLRFEDGVSVRAQDGKFLWGYNDVANDTANISTPIVKGDFIFCSTGYGTGSALLKSLSLSWE